MNSKINEIKKDLEQKQEKEQEKEQQQQQQQKKRHILYVYIGDREPQRYDSKEWVWQYESESIRGYIQEYAKPETNVALYKYDILSIMKRDKSELRIISGNYTTKEIFEM